MARACAQKGQNLLLVALPGDELEETCRELREQHAVEVHGYGLDLTQPGATQQIYDWCKTEGFEVNILINNAGIGTGGQFIDIDLPLYQHMIQLNVQAMVELTYLLIPELKKHQPAHILSMSSMEANLPLPYKAVYTGTKNFIYAFSLAIREELREEGVKVSVVCPGPVVTNEDGMKRIKSQGWKAKILMKMPEFIAAYTLPRMLKGKAVIIPGTLPNVLMFLGKILPTGLKMRLLERIFRAYKHHANSKEVKAQP